ncbi:MAG: thiamine pyrophosphate-requiring protein [Rhodocyclaceae bacterium]|nr:thiamine pyrophosphate-requiring protein [Rhodocyclaceae bacterium]
MRAHQPAPVTGRRSTAHFLLQALRDQGIEYLFGNLGTDHAPLIEELARWRAEGRPAPTVLLCPHENTAIHMAGGYAAATGRGQAVMVHVDAGTANASMGMHNLFRARLPVLLMAGRAPFSSNGELPGGRDTYVHFVQEPFDQGSLVRPYVKWEYTLPSGVVASEVVARACAVMHSDPAGPAYLMLPREVLAADCDSAGMDGFPSARHAPVRHRGTDPHAIRAVAERLLAAREPLLVTAYAGRQLATPPIIDRLARLAGIRVCEFNTINLNISRKSPCFAGYQPAPFAQTTDFGLLVDVDVPWVPKTTRPNPNAYWVQMDVDAIKRELPMWPFAADLSLEGDSAHMLEQLVEAVEALATPDFRTQAAQRLGRLSAEHTDRERAAAERAADSGTPGHLNPHHVCAALGRALDSLDIVFNEAIRNTLAVFEQIPRTQPGTLVGLPGGGLGFSGGMALGYKLAHPDRRVVHIVGDGGFHLSNPASLYATARQYRLPIFTVVLDNGGWAAVKEATLRMYPEGIASQQRAYESVLAPQVDFTGIVAAAGGYGERLDDPDQVEGAMTRCLAALDAGRSALLQVALGPH